MSEEWGVIYMPATEQEDPSMSGFKSKTEAEAYTRKYWCKKCRDSYAKALRWERTGTVDVKALQRECDSKRYDTPKESWEAHDKFIGIFGEHYPACSCEWIIDRIDKIDKCETVEDMMRMIGYNPESNDEENDNENV